MGKNNKKIRGQLLIESLVGISIVTVGLLGVVGLVSRSLSLNRVVSDKFTASYLSLEGIEIVRNLLDANVIKGNWNEGFDSGENYGVYYGDTKLESDDHQSLFFDVSSGFYGGVGESTPFKRIIRVVNRGDEIQVNSIVEWTTRGGGAFKVDNEYHFYNWR